ncbi:MAG: hypothetical protein JO244_14715, partial [Solirubrobacterales bacterium]|nr:hypothetical protein [Solirubrobacterales bacterium]
MTAQPPGGSTRRDPSGARARLLVLGAALGLCGAAGIAAEGQKAGGGSRSATAGTSLAPRGTLLRRSAPDSAWEVVPRGEALPAGDLILGLPGAAVDSSNGAVRLQLMTDVDQRSPYPVLEAAVRLHQSAGVDLDFTLDRGRVDVTNNKKKGMARVRIRAHGQTWEAVLRQPQTRLALELYGRWPRGVPFTKNPGPADVPAADLLILVLHGEVDLKYGPNQYALSAPPGPAQFGWDNVAGPDPSPRFLEHLPDWATAKGLRPERVRQVKERLERFRKLVADKGVKAAVDTFLASDDPLDRGLAVIVLGATDDLENLARVLAQPRQRDVWDRTVLVARHWLGRAPGQDLKAYRMLIKIRGYTPTQAETVLQMLHGFGDADLALPETYQMLIAYLDHEKVGIRGLAHWHLVRLVPTGQSIAYNPLDSREARER